MVVKKVRSPTGRTSASSRRQVWIRVAVLAMVIAAGVTGAFIWSVGSRDARHAYALAPESALPANIRQAPGNVRDAYRFAIANREILGQIPCYCGCGTERHKSNVDCYIKDVRPDGSVVFDPMSFG